MRVFLFATAMLTAFNEAISLPQVDQEEPYLFAQTSQLDDMATEIAQTRKEMNDSDKKHMGESKFSVMSKAKKIFEQKTSLSSSLATEIDRILKLPVKKKPPPPKTGTAEAPKAKKEKKPAEPEKEKEATPPLATMMMPTPAEQKDQ